MSGFVGREEGRIPQESCEGGGFVDKAGKEVEVAIAGVDGGGIGLCYDEMRSTTSMPNTHELS